MKTIRQRIFHRFKHLALDLNISQYPIPPLAVRDIWNRAAVHPAYDPALMRQDPYGSLIRCSDYGCRKSPYGWTIGPRIPTLWAGDPRMLNALQPVHCRNRKRWEKKWNPVVLV